MKGEHFVDVDVWPHGDESKKARGIVALGSTRGRSIAVVFEDKPAFATLSQGIMIGPRPDGRMGIILFASRLLTDVEGRPAGPWIEVFAGGHYEMEDA